jgi:hypothetical protein
MYFCIKDALINRDILQQDSEITRIFTKFFLARTRRQGKTDRPANVPLCLKRILVMDTPLFFPGRIIIDVTVLAMVGNNMFQANEVQTRKSSIH